MNKIVEILKISNMNKLKLIGMLLPIFIGMSCSSVKETGAQKKEAKAISGFLVGFESAVVAHDAAKLLDLIDRDYLNEQCYGLMEGNTEKFINELFCGNLINGDQFICLTFAQIDRLELLQLEKQDDYYTVVYRVGENGAEINANWAIIVNKVNGKIVCGLEGPRG